MENNGLEIERKFLVEKYKEPIDGERRLDIRQTYLIRKSPSIQRRVRIITDSSGKTVCFYTEKRFISPAVREENEKVISREEYGRLITEKDNSLAEIVKVRRVFIYKCQRFEMDEFPFSDELATLELELDDENREIFLPPFITVVKEVTGNGRYSNAAMAKSQKIER